MLRRQSGVQKCDKNRLDAESTFEPRTAILNCHSERSEESAYRLSDMFKAMPSTRRERASRLAQPM